MIRKPLDAGQHHTPLAFYGRHGFGNRALITMGAQPEKWLPTEFNHPHERRRVFDSTITEHHTWARQ